MRWGLIFSETLFPIKQHNTTPLWITSSLFLSPLSLPVCLTSSFYPGPVCSACVDNFGARPVTIFSGVMVAGGLMLSAFAPNVQFLIFSYGIVVGKETLDDKLEGHAPVYFIQHCTRVQAWTLNSPDCQTDKCEKEICLMLLWSWELSKLLIHL